MKVWGMLLGGFPRSRRLRHVLRDVERGTAPYYVAEAEVDRFASQVIGAQLAAGFPVVVDGMADWHDIFRPFVDAWRNVTVDGLLRYFDNNFFYRIPVFTDEPDARSFVLSRRVYRFRDAADPAGVKVVMPGPVTFAYMSKNLSGLSTEELAERIAFLLREEARKALDAGASLIQVDEPFLADIDATPDHARLAVDLVNSIVDGFGDRAVLSLYYGVPEPGVYEVLLDVKARYLMLDVADAPARASSLLKDKGAGGHVLALGVVDARRIIDDDESRIIELVKGVAGGSEELVLTTSTWMDLIPYRYALRKTIILGRIVESVASSLGADVWSIWG